MLYLSKILDIKQNDYSNYKIHFAMGSKQSDRFEPLDKFKKGEFKEWQEYQNKHNFERDYIVSLIYYKKDKWLFAGVYKSTGYIETDESNRVYNNKYKYDTELIRVQEDLIGKIIIKYDKAKENCRQPYVNGENYFDKLKVSEILEKSALVERFNGYNNVNIDYERLKMVINENENTWKTALSIMKGVYLIVDKNNGKYYVGSATGIEALWSRWSDYIKNGHGNNKGLKKIIDANGIKYANNFKFSILEIMSLNSDDETIFKREAFWKDVLLTRKYGYNEN
jgi:hypothetical protein